MTTQLAPAPVFRSWDNSGNPLAGGQLFSYQAGTTTPQATYIDSTQTTQNTNPVILNARGEASVWLDPTLTYKLVLQDSLGNQIWSQDQIVGGYVPISNLAAYITQSFIGQQLYPRTAAEVTANVTPVNLFYPPGHVDRYATNGTPGTTSMTAAFQAAINQARVGGLDVVWGETAPYLLDNVLDCTFSGAGAQWGLNFRQISTPGINYPPTTRCGLLASHNAYAVFDLTGCNRFTFYDLSLTTGTGFSPITCFLTARNSTLESNLPNFYNTFVNGAFSAAVLYNYASEDGVYVGNKWFNSSTATAAKLVVITTSNNVGSPNGPTGNGPAGVGMVSSFVTIATGTRSTIDHQFIGGQYVMTAPSSSSDLFYLDNCQNLKMYGSWLQGLAARSYFFCELTNGPASHIRLNSIQGEVGSGPNNGVLIPNASGTPSDWVVQDVSWDVAVTSIATAGATPVVDNFRMINIQEAVTRGLSVLGTLQNSTIDYSGTITIGTSSHNVIIGNLGNMTITTHTGDVVIDRTAGGLQTRGGVGMWGNTPAGQLTGWGTPVGGVAINNYNITDAGGANSNTNKAVAAIISQLKALGLLGT